MARTPAKRKYTRKVVEATPPPPQTRFLVVNMDCHNAESIHKTLAAALDTVSERVEDRDWEADEIYILEVTAIHACKNERVTVDTASIDQLDYDL